MLMLNIKALHKLAVRCLAPTNHPASVCPSLGRSASAAAERRWRLVTRQGHRTGDMDSLEVDTAQAALDTRRFCT